MNVVIELAFFVSLVVAILTVLRACNEYLAVPEKAYRKISETFIPAIIAFVVTKHLF